MLKISSSILKDLLKNKAIIIYFLLLSAMGWGIFSLESQPEKAILALLQVTLFVLPLVTMVFASIYYYNSMEFILLLLAQPIRRSAMIGGLYFGLSGGFAIAFIAGIGLPLLVFYPDVESLFLIVAGLLLTYVFTALALLISARIQDKARGMGVSLIVWAFFAFIFDGLLLLLMYQLSDYPIERPVLVLSFLNPVDIARILVIMKTEASAMLGLSGVVFQEFFGSFKGVVASVAALIAWTLLPFFTAKRIFSRKDL